MGHRDELEIEWPDGEALPHRHFAYGYLQLAAVFGKLGLEQRRRELRRIDRHLQPGPQLDHSPEVILVCVGQHQTCQRVAVGLDEAQIGQHHIGAGIELALGKRDAEIDHQPLAAAWRA